jgi:acyl-CoA thioesterase-1
MREECDMSLGASLVSIVCFGDSLTAGYQSPTHDVPYVQETPYGAFLQDRIGAQATVVISGVCGEVTGDMVGRFRRDVLAHRPHYVVILGGTNDLGWNAPPAEIFSRLRLMYERALGAGVQPVAVTVPSIRMDADPDTRQWIQDLVRRRQELNRLILDYCVRQALACVDLFAATAEPDTWFLAQPYSNDGLHLTTEGYQKMARLLYEEVFRPQVKEKSEHRAQ